jgi:hypothetical protein
LVIDIVVAELSHPHHFKAHDIEVNNEHGLTADRCSHNIWLFEYTNILGRLTGQTMTRNEKDKKIRRA